MQHILRSLRASSLKCPASRLKNGGSIKENGENMLGDLLYCLGLFMGGICLNNRFKSSGDVFGSIFGLIKYGF